MRLAVFNGALVLGVLLTSAGVAWRYSVADALMASGAEIIVLTFLTLIVAAGRVR